MVSFSIVSTKQGDLKGLVEKSTDGKDYFSFLGIPYAEPPVGKLRFKDPIPAKSWTGVKEAIKEGGLEAQYDMLTSSVTGGDDCLYLNVYVPKSSSTTPLPVIAHIHGGGFIQGTGSKGDFGPDYVVEKDIILVSMNYRVGVMGFLCTDPVNARGDMGLKDQNLALKWIQENITSFNGDPRNVTLMGISAGAASVEYHILSKQSKDLFHKAIMQSGSVFNPWARTRNAVKMAERLGKTLGYNSNSGESLFDFINKFDTEAIVKASINLCTVEDMKNDAKYFAFSPVVNEFRDYEGFVDQEPAELMKKGEFNKVPTIVGVCEKEGIFMKILYKYDEVKLLLKNFQFYDLIPTNLKKDIQDLSGKLAKVYTHREDNDAATDFLTDLTFSGGVFYSLEHRLEHSGCNNYLFCFQYDGNMNLMKKILKSTERGACHADDSFYLIPSEAWKDATAEDHLVKSRFLTMWTDFAKTGNPTPRRTAEINETWRPVSKENYQYLEINTDIKMFNMLWPQRRHLWKEILSNP